VFSNEAASELPIPKAQWSNEPKLRVDVNGLSESKVSLVDRQYSNLFKREYLQSYLSLTSLINFMLVLSV
jgi:hypothetical protein